MCPVSEQVIYPSDGDEASTAKVVAILEQLQLSHLLQLSVADAGSMVVRGVFRCGWSEAGRDTKDDGCNGGRESTHASEGLSSGRESPRTARAGLGVAQESSQRRHPWSRLWGSGARSTARGESAPSSPASVFPNWQHSRVRDWAVILSPGEQQRLGVARVLYHRPALAFFDESTSAVAEVMERRIYELLEREGVTVVSVGHRASLRELHRRVLSLSGPPDGEWSLSDIEDAGARAA